ncbi:uncharacterized protein LY79DRAFT_353370 [Colletotrichum navitas]|uniref:Uncharacterized protein n=1 Tax=Colletotrichum navitas TaxID=681940 RepID=A0AAD8QA69_9PEZI|nr:uncharacterized protein LY79DRAFT_353370 [Colletotrichum navitas]KAK1597688.1 hypothetical protein LY79DRAFT_353370 [Colletotrichum navitas]
MNGLFTSRRPTTVCTTHRCCKKYARHGETFHVRRARETLRCSGLDRQTDRQTDRTASLPLMQLQQQQPVFSAIARYRPVCQVAGRAQPRQEAVSCRCVTRSASTSMREAWISDAIQVHRMRYPRPHFTASQALAALRSLTLRAHTTSEPAASLYGYNRPQIRRWSLAYARRPTVGAHTHISLPPALSRLSGTGRTMVVEAGVS